MAGKLSQLLQGMEEEAPKKKKPASLEVDLEMPEEADADMAEDDSSDADMEDEEMADEEASPLMDAADEDLLAALEARGLDVSAVRKQLETSEE